MFSDKIKNKKQNKTWRSHKITFIDSISAISVFSSALGNDRAQYWSSFLFVLRVVTNCINTAKDSKLKSVGIFNLGFNKQPYICSLKSAKNFNACYN